MKIMPTLKPRLPAGQAGSFHGSVFMASNKYGAVILLPVSRVILFNNLRYTDRIDQLDMINIPGNQWDKTPDQYYRLIA